MNYLSTEEKIDDLILDAGIQVISGAPDNFALALQNSRYICLADDLPEDIRILAKAHEYAHFKTNTLYDRGENDKRMIGKCEETAFRYTAALLLPHIKLCQAIKKERTFDPYALGDCLSLPPSFVARCEKLYFEIKEMEIPYIEN